MSLGLVRPETLICKEGENEWSLVINSELSEHFSSVGSSGSESKLDKKEMNNLFVGWLALYGLSELLDFFSSVTSGVVRVDSIC